MICSVPDEEWVRYEARVTPLCPGPHRVLVRILTLGWDSRSVLRIVTVPPVEGTAAPDCAA